MKIKKWDKVLVNTWKDKWKQWKVLLVLVDKNSVVVEWVNLRTKYKKKTREWKWDMFRVEFPIDASNVQVLWSDWKPTKVAYKINDKWKKYRVAKSTWENLDKNVNKLSKSK